MFFSFVYLLLLSSFFSFTFSACSLLHNSVPMWQKRYLTEEINLTVNPADGYHLKECKKHDGHYSSVMVHQLENIDSHLKRYMYLL